MKVDSTQPKVPDEDLKLERKLLENDKKELESEKTKLEQEKKEFEEKQTLENCYKYLRPVIGLYLISVLLILCYLAVDNYFATSRALTIQTIIYIACAGGIGGTMSAMTALSGHQEDFKRHFTFWYIFRPIGGIIIGVFVYFLLFANLLVLNLPTGAVSSTSTVAYSALAFLAGFATKQVATKLNELATTLFAQESKEPYPEKKTQ